jgi:TRAP-type C4-dicarboxylate transport system permease small subunit
MNNKNALLGVLDNIASKFEKVIEVIVSILLTLIALAVFVGVIGRNINIPVVWLGELSTYSTIWVTFFGFALAYKYDMFANVDLISGKLSERNKKIIQILWNVFAIAFMTLLLWSGKDYIAHVAKSGTVSSELRIPLSIVYMGPFIGYIFTTYFGIVKLIKQILELKSLSNSKNNKTNMRA